MRKRRTGGRSGFTITTCFHIPNLATISLTLKAEHTLLFTSTKLTVFKWFSCLTIAKIIISSKSPSLLISSSIPMSAEMPVIQQNLYSWIHSISGNRGFENSSKSDLTPKGLKEGGQLYGHCAETQAFVLKLQCINFIAPDWEIYSGDLFIISITSTRSFFTAPIVACRSVKKRRT